MVTAVGVTRQKAIFWSGRIPRCKTGELQDTWQRWVHDTCGMPMEILEVIRQNMQALNESIASDRQLGPQFQVGHSYVTPSQGTTIAAPVQWFINVVETEIFPLLEEYWYDEPSKAEEWASALKEALK